MENHFNCSLSLFFSLSARVVSYLHFRFQGDTILYKKSVRSDATEEYPSILNVSHEYVATEPVTCIDYQANVSFSLCRENTRAQTRKYFINSVCVN